MRLGNVVGVPRQTATEHLGVDARVSRTGILEPLQHHETGTLAERESDSHAERAAGTLGYRLESREPGSGQLRVRICSAGDHRARAAGSEQIAGVSDGARARAARARDRGDGPAHAELLCHRVRLVVMGGVQEELLRRCLALDVAALVDEAV